MVLLSQMHYLKSPNLKNYTHGFFTRKGGVSKGIYNSLNCGMSSNDSNVNVLDNRRAIANELKFKINHLVIANQYHSKKVEIIDSIQNNLKCDAIISLVQDIKIGVLTADCCPVLVGEKNQNIKAVIHIGWKGLYKNIIENFMNKTLDLNIQPKDLIVALGPCIGKDSYQVSDKFRNDFTNKDLSYKKFFMLNKFNKSFYFDIRGLIEKKFKDNGVSDLWTSEADTYKESDTYFSYRRSSHQSISDYGRMLSII